MKLNMRKLAGSLLTAALAAVAGCATQNMERKPPRPGQGLSEYRRIVIESQKDVADALRSLGRVSAQTNRCPPKMCAAFSRKVQWLQVESLKVRARVEAMQARGDAYFEHWDENLERITDPKVRGLVDEHRAQLQQRFNNIKQESQQAREAFRPFLSGLRKLNNALEKDPGTVGAVGTRDLIRATDENGRQVEQALAAIREELRSMKLLATPPVN